MIAFARNFAPSRAELDPEPAPPPAMNPPWQELDLSLTRIVELYEEPGHHDLHGYLPYIIDLQEGPVAGRTYVDAIVDNDGPLSVRTISAVHMQPARPGEPGFILNRDTALTYQLAAVCGN